MPKITLQEPVDLGDFVVREVLFCRPGPQVFQAMKAIRSPVIGFTEQQALHFACQLTHFGRLFYRLLGDADRSAMRKAMDGVFYFEIQRRLSSRQERAGK